MRELTVEDGRAAALGGMVFGAGSGGLEIGLRIAETAVSLGPPCLASLDEFDDGAQAFVSSGVGAPGATKQNVLPRDKLRCFELLREAIIASPAYAPADSNFVGMIIGHPGAIMTQSWLHGSVDPRIAILDCATNGRGHPSVKMGGMGLASDPLSFVTQSGVGGVGDHGQRLEVVIQGPFTETSDVMRSAAAVLGGRIAACRGPFSIGFLKQSGAVGAISASIDLGMAMFAAQDRGAKSLISAVTDTLGGKVAISGTVIENTVELRGAYDAGRVLVEGDNGTADLAVCNEYMALDIDGQRVASFPDLITTLSDEDGMPSPVIHTKPGDHVSVIVVDRKLIPLGAGVFDPSVYPGVEALIERELVSYAIGRTE